MICEHRRREGRSPGASRVVVGAVLASLVFVSCSSGHRRLTSPPSESTSSTSSTTTAATTTAATTTTVASPSITRSTSTSTSLPAGSTGLGFYLPLFPFATGQQVEQWQTSYHTAGHQPWHLEAGLTATAFADWLGYTDVDTVISQNPDAPGENVAIGPAPKVAGTNPVTAAVVHLLRWGTGPDAPWEVVGTDDTTFSLQTPAYGSAVTSPLVVRGLITGVDQEIKVQIRDPSSAAPVGSYCCLASGGTNTPWSLTVSFSAPPDVVLTIAAQAGGQAAGVERFAVTAVRSGP